MSATCAPSVGTNGKGEWTAVCRVHDWRVTYGDEKAARRGAAAHKRAKRTKRT